MEFLSFYTLALIVAGSGAAYVLAPLLGPKRQVYGEMRARTEAGPEKEVKEAQEQRDRIYAILSELDQDFAVGDLNKTDYQELRTYYKQQAVEALLVLDRVQAVQDRAKAEIEADVARMRVRIEAKETGKPKTKSKKPSSSLIQPPEEEYLCKHCGNKARAGAAYCSGCGAKLHHITEKI